MTRDKRSNAIFGIVLIGLGFAFLLGQLMPGLWGFLDISRTWPLIMVGVGGLLFALAIVSRESGLAVPASIVGGLGMLMFYQNLTGDWASWSYAWALIPGFVGVGIVLQTLLGGKSEAGYTDGLTMIGISAAMFLAFGTFFGAFGILGQLWPVALILVGAGLLARTLLVSR